MSALFHIEDFIAIVCEDDERKPVRGIFCKYAKTFYGQLLARMLKTFSDLHGSYRE